MNKFIKFSYYNILIAFFLWVISYLYKINILITIIGMAILVILFIYITPKILRIINDSF